MNKSISSRSIITVYLEQVGVLVGVGPAEVGGDAHVGDVAGPVDEGGEARAELLRNAAVHAHHEAADSVN